MKPITALLLLLGIVAACLSASITLVLIRPSVPAAVPSHVIVVPVNPSLEQPGGETVIAHGAIRYLVPTDNMPMVLKP